MVMFSIWVAILAGVAEVAVQYVRWQRDPLQHLSPDFPWMAPIALIAVTLLAIAPAALVPRGRARRWTMGFCVFAALALACLDLLLLVPGLAHYAAALLAAGIAAQTARIALRRQVEAGRFARRTAIPLIVLAAAVLGAVSLRVRPQADAPRNVQPAPAGSPNVILITLDTVRAANLSLYGSPRATSPSIDRFAARGVVFETAFATAPWTLSSYASLFTGRWPHELSAGFSSPLDRTYPTLAEYFSSRGYRTAGFVANLRYCGRPTGLARGFLHYEDYPRSLGEFVASSTLLRQVADNFRLRRFIQNDQHVDRIDAAALNARTMAWLDREPAGPFFLFLNYFDAHEPYLPPPPFDRRFGRGRARGRHSPLHHWLWNPAARHAPLTAVEHQEEVDAYDGAIASLDAEVGRLLAWLDAKGHLSNAVVVVTADHGEELGEHGLYDHGYSLYRASLNVPLVLVAPGRVPAGRRVATPISLRDLPATVVDVVNGGGGTAFPGASLAGLWDDARPAGLGARPSPLYAEVRTSPGQPDWFPSSKGDMQSVVHRGLRYIRNGDGREELYDFDGDPWEQRDLSSQPEYQSTLGEARALVEGLRRGGR